MKKNGFTLVELLAVIVILGVILAIAVPAVQNTINSSKDKLYDIVVSEIKASGKQYAIKYPSSISGFNDNSFGYVTIDNLVDTGLLNSPVNNPITGSEFKAEARIRVTKPFKGNYRYTFFPNVITSPTLTFNNSISGSGSNFFEDVIMGNKGVIAVGYSTSNDGNLAGLNQGGKDAIIAKYDINGNLSWIKDYGTSSDEGFRRVVYTGDGYIAVGYTGNLGLLVKYDRNGNILWHGSYGSSSNIYTFNKAIMDDENIIIVGYKQDSSGNKNAIIIKYDLDGNLVWNYDFGGGGTDRFNDVIYTGDGYIAVGDSSSNDGNMLGLSIGGTDAIIVKYNLDGSILSKKVVGGNNTDQFSSIELTVDDKFLLIGNSDSTNGDIQGLTTKGNNDGIMFYYEPDATDTSKLNLVWKKNFGGSNTDNFSQIIILPDGYYVIGYTNSTDGDCSNLETGILGGNSGIILLRYSSNGSLIWKELIGAGQSYNYFRGSVYDNRLIIAGNFNAYDNGDAIIMGFDEGE